MGLFQLGVLMNPLLGAWQHFTRLLGNRFYTLIAFMFVAALFEGLSVAMFLPILQSFGGSSNDHPLALGLTAFFSFMGIPLTLGTALAAMIFCFVLGGAVLVCQTAYLGRLQSTLLTQLRVQQVARLYDSQFLFFTSKPVGFFSNAITREFEGVAFAFNMFSATLVRGIFVSLYLTFALVTNPPMTILTGVFMLVLYPAVRFINKRVKNISITSSELAGQLQNLLIQGLSHFKYFKATSTQTGLLKQVNRRSQELGEKIYEQSVFAGISQYGFKPFVIAFVAALLYFQVQIKGGHLGDSLFVLLLLHKSLSELLGLQQNYRKFVEYSGSLGIFTQLVADLEQHAEASKTQSAAKLPDFEKPIVFDRVNFSYVPQQAVLKELSFTIQPRSTVAFVGTSGAGKSSLVNLITAILVPQEGDIRLGDSSYRDIDRTQLRKQIGYITQESVVFNDSVENNVSLWADKPSAEKLEKSLQKAHILDVIRKLPQGLASVLGDHGIKISGGQRQRIAIARELYKDAKLLIFDEATSSLDSQTERMIQQDIDHLHGDKTVILIAHRLSTVQRSDVIFVLKEGRIVEQGSYDNLSKNGKEFQSLLAAQSLSS
jgi:ABC-type multidrug transport system fused ATPase/permease subunit